MSRGNNKNAFDPPFPDAVLIGLRKPGRPGKKGKAMHALAGEAILTAWEKSRALPEQEAAVAVLALACKEKPEELARLPLGERNALLLELRAATLGRRMEGFAVCAQCGEQLEFALDPLELIKGLRTQPADAPLPDGYTMRPANTLDLLASRAAQDEEQARSILLARTLSLTQPQASGSNEAWLLAQTAGARAELAARFEEANASAEILVQLQCAGCKGRSLMNLDVARFLLREIAFAARRLMAEIHELASAYGWSERSITSMSSMRRTAYLERIGA